MQNMTMTKMRNASLRSAVGREYARARREGLLLTDRQIIERAVKSPVADGYFVGLDYAVKMERRVRCGNLPGNMSALRRSLWTEIAAKVAARQRRYREKIVDSVSEVLSGAIASRYFVDPSKIKMSTLKY